MQQLLGVNCTSINFRGYIYQLPKYITTTHAKLLSFLPYMLLKAQKQAAVISSKPIFYLNSSRKKGSVSRNLAGKVDKPEAPVALSVQEKWT
jgi:hypothetical protein